MQYVFRLCRLFAKQLDELTDFVTKPQVAQRAGLIKIWRRRFSKSSVDKYYTTEDLAMWTEKNESHKRDLILVMTGDKNKILPALSVPRLEMGTGWD